MPSTVQSSIASRPRMTERGCRPLIGVVCCNEVRDRPVQVVASRFIDPLVQLSEASVLLVPALPSAIDARDMAGRLDGLLLTGSRSNVAGHRYGLRCGEPGPTDERRDEVALALAGAMIDAGRPVFGICRGLQELNVLFGGSLTHMDDPAHHADEDERGFEGLFDHRHEVELAPGGLLNPGPARKVSVVSVHRQGINRLGAGLKIEARATDCGLVEAFSSRPNGADVLGVQWHPEWNLKECGTSRDFFALIGASLRGTTIVGRTAYGT